ncbi:MAG TPA: hypothetical protein VNF48_03240 [Gammaproteobacteria bacterium]|nr:hypothetical protein [Gammaproteobacteria bacterium]
MNTTTETTFLHWARTVFVKSLEQLDTRELARLRQARALAVESIAPRVPFWRRRAWAIPAGAMATVLIVIASGVLWWNQNAQPAVPFATGNNNEDMSIVLGNDNLDMYADMDFYKWLQAQQQSPSQSSSGDNSSG